MTELSQIIWNDTIRKFNPKPGWIISYACISETWRSKLTNQIAKEIEAHGKSLGFKTKLEFGKFNWIIIKKK